MPSQRPLWRPGVRTHHARRPEIPANAQSSKIYAADGTLITTLHGPENRIEVPLTASRCPMQQAVMAIEDERFYYHPGVDLRAMLRAAQTNAEAGASSRAGRPSPSSS